MNHPIHYLPVDGSLQAQHMDELAKHCSSSKPDPTDPARTVFTFLAGDINDIRDRVVVADPAGGHYTMGRPDGCVCRSFRAPIECQCSPTRCRDCGGEFTAIEPTCDFLYCLYDECQLCTHQREDCHAQEIERNINGEWQTQRAGQPDETDASNLYGAVAEVLGAESGDAPNYPVVRRILGRIAGSGDDESAWEAAGRLSNTSRPQELRVAQLPGGHSGRLADPQRNPKHKQPRLGWGLSIGRVST